MRLSSKLAALTVGASLFAFSAAQAQTKVGFIYVGPVEDLGWTFRHDVGRKAVEAGIAQQIAIDEAKLNPGIGGDIHRHADQTDQVIKTDASVKVHNFSH